MKPRTERGLFVAAGVIAAVFSLFCVTDLMRESDQASILTGSWTLFKGASVRGQEFYNYDKHYLLYWLLAWAFRLRGLFGGAWSPVFAADICAAVTFWCTLLIALVRLGLNRNLPPWFAPVCFLLTPAILLNSIYANAAIVSAGLLVLCAVLLDARTGWKSDLPAALLFFAAVGVRGDAVLLAPLLVWLRLPRQGWFRRALTAPSTWMLAGSGVAALWLGDWLYSGPRQYAAFLDSKFQRLAVTLLAGYSVFGLGPSLALLILLVVRLGGMARRRMFYGIGAVCLLIPSLYYSLQLYSPRYLILSAVSPMIFSVSRRGTAFWKMHARTRLVTAALRGVLLASAILFLVGIDVALPARPRATFTRPTLFPTTDGLYPMGAWGSFMLKLRNAPSEAVDHNQLLWMAAQSARYVPSSDGYVHLFNSPMYSYLELAVTVDGLRVRKEETDAGRPLYADSRSLTRIGSGQVDNGAARLLADPAEFVSDVYEGIGILRFNAGGSREWERQTRLLNRLFAGNEYRLTRADRPDPDLWPEGRLLVFFGAQPFEVRPGTSAMRDEASGLYYVQIGSSDQARGFRFSGADTSAITLAAQALPAWMSVKQ